MTFFTESHEEADICKSLGETNTVKQRTDLFVPDCSSLHQTVQAAADLAHHARRRLDTMRWCHVYSFFKVTIQKRRLNVKLPYCTFVLTTHGEENSNRVQTRDW